MTKKVTYSDIINFIEQNKLTNRFNVVSFCIGYYGVFTTEMWEFTQRAYTDSFIEA